MSFKNRNLSVIAYANGWTMWHYVAENDEIMEEIVKNDRYFENVASLMNAGDFILFNTKNESGIRVIESIENKAVRLTTLK